MKQVDISWSYLKTLSVDKNLKVQFQDWGSTYDVFVVENEILWQASLYKESSEAIDFETNYKSTANQRSKQFIILQDEFNKVVTSTTFSPKQALDINIAGSTGFPFKYKPRVFTVTSDIIINNGNTYTLFNYSGAGQGADILIKTDHKTKTYVILEVDGVEIYNLLVDTVQSRLDNSNNTTFYGGAGLPTFVDLWKPPFDFATNLTVKIKAVGTNVKLQGAVIKYRILS